MFWKKKTQLTSNEYEELTKKFVSLVGDIDRLSNAVAVYTESIKTMRAQLGALKRQEVKDGETEKDISEVKYL